MKIAGYLIVTYMHACMRGQLNLEKKVRTKQTGVYPAIYSAFIAFNQSELLSQSISNGAIVHRCTIT